LILQSYLENYLGDPPRRRLPASTIRVALTERTAHFGRATEIGQAAVPRPATLSLGRPTTQLTLQPIGGAA
jgi:hypothetical protein